RKYLLDFASKNNLSAAMDTTGNILIVKPASPGFERKKTVILQSHMDMVGESIAGHHHNWETDPIIPEITDGWVHARNTTLGSDDGIGIAAQLAILEDKNLKTGKIECLFTVDEESGMTGATNLDPDFFSGQILINLDSEDEGILFIGCAGGIDTTATMNYQSIQVPEESNAYEISLTGLHGGHSGDEIHKGYGNSVKIMSKLLYDLTLKYRIGINSFNGGNVRNAIPREALAIIVSNPVYNGQIVKKINNYYLSLTRKFGELESGMKISVKNAPLPDLMMDSDSQMRLLKALVECPDGVIKWSDELEDLVETSTNLASVKFVGENTIKIITTQRSSVEKEKHQIAERIKKCFSFRGADVCSSDGYPGWRPNLSSEILNITKSSYLKILGKEVQVKAIHAGLECGLIYEKNKNIDMISFGPTIKGAHTPDEMINIESVGRFWDLLIDVLRNIPEK
ncbi:MAG: aminoacyl-histidine dipeptidase, partial [Bacteroidales bacterium]